MKYMNHDEYQRGWRSGFPETPCGSGSTIGATKIQRTWIPEMVAKHGIESIADIGAGDLNWIKRITLGCDYAPYDLIPRTEGVKKLNMLKDKLPESDCLMVLWVLNHFSPEKQRKAMRKLLKADARYLMITFDNRLEPIIDQPYIDMVVIRRDRGIDSEIRLIKI